ncbi:rRNA maturation RNase YbeY [Aliifodinibius sp. S!AR15-10]|uniref:rRNA maturation RNase YbeY n=1 Tax=Aliifodinibius sp. S!AR15-10 TaxID=2950437 RepID=UPI00286574E0|nr:rRNA maturation RNase YbeY [Aliifodinibius sp. S!AR15-10]MDR8392302.1 rRNA maturation RNase YbeY [Aliifodinibius sp. S!AR15-10]
MPLKETEVSVFNESGRSVPIDERIARKCISEVARQEACSFSMIEVVYVDETKIREVNIKHLDHHYVTDIITFRYDEDHTNTDIEGTLFCCAQRIAEQAGEFAEDEDTEFKRVLIHGLLHLAGYNDKSDEGKKAMREREDFYLRHI